MLSIIVDKGTCAQALLGMQVITMLSDPPICFGDPQFRPI